MSLEPGDIFSLANLLNDGYVDIAEFSMVVAGAGSSIDAHSAPGELNRFRIFRSVEAACKGGWIASLLDSVEQESVNRQPRFQPGHPIRQEIARLRTLLLARAAEVGLAAGSDPADALIVFRRPFINRSTFRLDLGRFAMGNQSRVFAIKGPRSSGKSHSWYFIRHYCETRSRACLALVDLSGRNPDACRPRDLMELLAGQMDLNITSMPADSLAQDARMGEKLTIWLTGKSQTFERKGQAWWIGFDGLDQPQANQGVIDLVSRLALAIEAGLLKNTWLFLLGLNDALPPAIDSFVFRELVTGLNRSELRRYLRSLVEGRQGTIEDAALDKLIDFAFDALPDPLQPESMRVFGDRVSEIMKRL